MSLSYRPEILGFCRFSFLGFSDWKTHYRMRRRGLDTQQMLSKMERALFAPARLEHRFKTFETLCLPSLIHQTDQDFRFVIITSDRLPEEYMARLLGLCEPHENIIIQPEPPGPLRRINRRLVAALSHQPGQRPVEFRLDDDDALPVTYIDRLRTMAQQQGSPDGFAFSLGRSLTVCTYQNEPVRTLVMTRPFFSAGAAVIANDTVRCVFNSGHFDLINRLPHFVDNNAIGSLALKHDGNDSRYVSADPEKLRQGNFVPIHKDQFDDHIKQDFPFLSRVDWTSLRAG